VLRRAFLALGLPAEHVAVAPDECAAVERALAWARPGDVVLLLVHVERDAVGRLLAARGARVIPGGGVGG
jgi:UDP-N-acetylmuramyl tripeptide synthase